VFRRVWDEASQRFYYFSLRDAAEATWDKPRLYLNEEHPPLAML
jgi:hypothetical protein